MSDRKARVPAFGKAAVLLGAVSLSACASQVLSAPSVMFAEPISVFFDNESVSLNGEAQAAVKRAMVRAQKFDCGKLLVLGQADGSAFERDGMKLSVRRADAVRDELARDGYKNAISVEGRGSSDPFKSNTSGQPEPLNRRVVISFGCRIN